MSEGAVTETRRPADWALFALALAVSVAVVWMVSGEPLVVVGFAAGAILLGGIAWAAAGRTPPPVEPGLALPDWSVTVAAIDHGDAAVAVTDRAGRLTCANPLYETWFGAGNAPPRLPVDAASLERLSRAARTAWRDGKGRADLVEGTGAGLGAGTEKLRWKAAAERAGRGEDFLVWRISPIVAADPVGELVAQIEGKLGRALALSGMAAAVVDPDGRIRAASAGFALRAAGDAQAVMAGTDFVSLLKQDDNDHITWARDGRKGQPLTMYYLPVADPDLVGNPDPETTPSLML